MDVTVVENAELDRFEALLPDGEVAGFVTYRAKGSAIVLLHTEIFDRYEGQGLGTTLVRGTLDQLRDAGRAYRPVCPFITAYLKRHPEYGQSS
jgi:predicted GNAT family acetyltransferase